MSFAVVGVLASSSGAEGAKTELLNRSLYIPVYFRLCEHLEHGVLYVEDQAVAQLPAEHIFMFTYYPSLKRIEPLAITARVEGVDKEGSPVTAHFAIGPKGIGTAHRTIPLDMEKHFKKLTYKIDVRYESVRLKIACKACGAPEHDEDALQDSAAQGAEVSMNQATPHHLHHR